MLPEKCPYVKHVYKNISARVTKKRAGNAGAHIYELQKKFFSCKAHELDVWEVFDPWTSLACLWPRPTQKKPKWLKKHWLKMSQLKALFLRPSKHMFFHNYSNHLEP